MAELKRGVRVSAHEILATRKLAQLRLARALQPHLYPYASVYRVSGFEPDEKTRLKRGAKRDW